MSRVVADSWYAGPLAERLPDVVRGATLVSQLPAPIVVLVSRSAALRAVALVLATGPADTLVTTNPAPGTRTLVAASGLLRRRNVVLLEYIAHPPTGRGLPSLLRQLAFRVLRQGLLPRAVRVAQVLTESERCRCAESHHAPQALFRHVPWPSRSSRAAALPERSNSGRRVLASGRRADWETFFAATQGRGWQVTAVCAAADANRVRALAVGSGATVLVEIEPDEHDAQVRGATVYVVALPETGASIGQIRVMNAADAGTPLVVSKVRGIESYVEAGTVVLVTPGDAASLGDAVDALLDDPGRQERLRRALFAAGARRTMEDYLDDVAHLV